jgi:hypothetical protein
MKDAKKSRKELIKEISFLRARLAVLEQEDGPDSHP